MDVENHVAIVSNILIHLVFSTKYRETWITPEVEPELHFYMVSILSECKAPVLAINGTADHVHILFALHRTWAVAGLVEVKKRSSKWIKTKGGAFESFAWQGGYGAFSVGQTEVEKIANYIAKQKAHHAETTFQDEMRALLDRYHIAYDERYVWD